jgi:signal peptidase II
MLETVIIILGVALDRLAKWLAVSMVKPLPGGDYALWPGVFHITYVENTGASFGILKNGGPVFIAIGVAVSAVILYLLLRRRDRFPLWVRCSMAAVVAGTVGNMIDRFAHGHVIDFFYFKLIDFAVFNVADALMVIGMILIAVYLVFFYKQPKRAGEKI